MNYERILRRLRQRVFDYDDTPNEAKASRVIDKLKSKKLDNLKRKSGPEPRGPYSGLTRSELRKTQTCEPDWQ